MIDDRVCKAGGAHNYDEAMAAIEMADMSLANFIRSRIPHPQWHQMVHEVWVEKRELYERLKATVEAMQHGDPTIAVGDQVVPTSQEGWAIANELAATYRCDVGFTDKPQTRTVIVTLKQPKAITGLPSGIIKASNEIARSFETVRKWTFGFDNRQFILDVDAAALKELQEHPFVESIEYEDEPSMRIMGTPKPPYDPLVEQVDWGVERILTAIPWGHSPAYLGHNVKLCVIDTGLDYTHPAFWKDGVCCYKGGFNFVASSDDPRDDQDHGTWCAGIAAERHNGTGYKGVVAECELYACKVLDSKGSGSLANVAAGIDWARSNGMHVISLSLGGSSGAAVLKAACDAAWYAGLVICASAGNSGPEDNTVGYPAAYQSVIAVAAIDYNEQVASFSSRGPEVEIAAPGVDITGPWAGFTYAEYATDDERYMCANGTSPACPHVAGAACLIKSWYPFMSNLDLRVWLRDHARDL